MSTIQYTKECPMRADEAIEKFYNKLWQNTTQDRHDSPDKSRITLARRMRTQIEEVGIPLKRILNIGSGPQALERQILQVDQQREKLLKQFEIVSLDRATIPDFRLLCRNNPNVTHVQADATNLPFNKEYFGMVVSNHAIDFAPRTAFNEAVRVLAPQGTALFNFHHPEMAKDWPTQGNSLIRTFWRHLDENQLLFENENAIVDYMHDIGLSCDDVYLETEKVGWRTMERWWEVNAHKAG